MLDRQCTTIVWGANHYCRLVTRLEAEEELRKLAVEEFAHPLKKPDRVVHELATNAAKYRALASPVGRLDIVWSVTAEEMGYRDSSDNA
jgi:hypothetical protein